MEPDRLNKLISDYAKQHGISTRSARRELIRRGLTAAQATGAFTETHGTEGRS